MRRCDLTKLPWRIIWHRTLILTFLFLNSSQKPTLIFVRHGRNSRHSWWFLWSWRPWRICEWGCRRDRRPWPLFLDRLCLSFTQCLRFFFSIFYAGRFLLLDTSPLMILLLLVVLLRKGSKACSCLLCNEELNNTDFLDHISIFVLFVILILIVLRNIEFFGAALLRKESF